jgi:hypothetical protein
MTPIRLHPDGLRLPWQALAGFAVAVYVLRSGLRGWDFVPNLADIVVFGGLAVLLSARGLLASHREADTDVSAAEDPEE